MPTAVLVLLAGSTGLVLGPAVDTLARWSLARRRGPGDDAPASAPPAPRPRFAAALAAVALAAVTWLLGAAPVLPAWWALAIVGTSIALADLARHRIPDPLVGLLATCGGVLLLGAALVEGAMADYARGGMAAGVSVVVFLALALAWPRGMGMGDAKLIPVLALFLGYQGWDFLAVGLLSAFLLAALASLAPGLLRWAAGPSPREAAAASSVGHALSSPVGVVAALRAPIPLGPFLIGGAILSLALVPALAVSA